MPFSFVDQLLGSVDTTRLLKDVVTHLVSDVTSAAHYTERISVANSFLLGYRENRLAHNSGGRKCTLDTCVFQPFAYPHYFT